ncbi:conserved hypothetical protein [Talaromyces stipitatus ATCC 10500]|uniref:Altered inheritance of mitochondria protein 19 n=1 Tax=Talaromyces stipitatus (strain ATCC 10500 / CBS 375.48 / QM 6759 / NRRL 1006) TaxID=441959 RepID=B8LTX1_TALSN|nr:uncharacterized protein TSTA_071970 [Talaromyces stipitatus ATCC 10500]EED23801.1 conserved hypothetical protein [Talaromyces stipitatus ATCC 10500]
MANSDGTEQAKKSVYEIARSWGENPLPPTLLATLITAQHMRPFQLLPMSFVPVLLFTSYTNVNGFKKDSAGISAAWSGLYLLLASRRKQAFMKKWGPRGIIRGASMGLALTNLVAGGLTYTLGTQEEEED